MTTLTKNVFINNDIEYMVSRDKTTQEILFYTDDKAYLYESLSNTLINRYVTRGLYVKRIKRVQHYTGFISILAYMNNNVIIEYHIKG